MSETEAPVPAAGWYADPAGAPVQRWWSGAEWTMHTQPYEAPVIVEPVPAQPEDEHYVPFGGGRALDVPVFDERRPRRNRQAYVGRGLSLLAVMVTILTIVALDMAIHIPGSDWGVYVTYVGVVLAPALAISGIIFSAIGLARMRAQGSGGVAAAGLTLGIAFTFAPFWIGLVLGIIVALTAHAA